MRTEIKKLVKLHRDTLYLDFEGKPQAAPKEAGSLLVCRPIHSKKGIPGQAGTWMEDGVTIHEHTYEGRFMTLSVEFRDDFVPLARTKRGKLISIGVWGCCDDCYQTSTYWLKHELSGAILDGDVGDTLARLYKKGDKNNGR